ncbi:MAG: ABC transporter C-terminal domain-containing protein, partial [Spirochaetaceae bacterium]|nr:ABC transporter C-terminal domain-containing protein [Spirochaetaceae bacterium]
KRLHRFPGGFSEYWAWRKRRESPVVAAGGVRERQPTQQPMEARIERLEHEKQELERQVSQALQSGDRAAERRHTARLHRVVRQIDRLYEEWADN